MLTKKIRRISKTGLLLVLLFFSLILFLDVLLQQPKIQEYFLTRLTEVSGFTIRTTRIEFSFWRGVGLLIHGLRAHSLDGSQGIRAKRVRVAMDVSHLLKGRLLPSGIELVRPAIRLDLETLRKGLNPESISKRPVGPIPLWVPWLQSVTLSEGRITFIKNSLSLEDLNGSARLDTGSPVQRILLHCQGYLEKEKTRIQFRLAGNIRALPEKVLPAVQLTLKTEKFPLSWFPWPGEILLKRGTLGAQMEMEGPLGGPLSVKGDIVLNHLDYELRKGIRKKTYRIPRILVDFESAINKRGITVPALTLKMDRASFSAGLTFDFEDSKDPYLGLKAKSSFMDFKTLASFFPTPLLPSWLETRLFPLLLKGDVRLDTLALKGKVSQFSELAKPDNREVLDLRFLCRDFRVFGLGMEIPFEAVSAEVLYEKGDFTIHRCNATCKDSHLRESSLKILGIAGDNPVYEAFLEGSFDLRQFLHQKNMDIIPPRVIRELDGLGLRSGRLDCRATFRYEKGWPVIRVTQGQFLLKDTRIDQERLRLPLALTEASILIDKDDQNPLRAKGVWGKTGFQVLGLLGGAAQGFPIRWLNFSADLEANEMVPFFHPKGGLPLGFNRPLPSRLAIMREKDSWSCRGECALEGVALRSKNLVLKPPGKENTLSFDLDIGTDGRMTLNTIRFDLGKSSLSFSGSYDPVTHTLSPLRVSVPSLAMEDIGLLIGSRQMPVQGILKGSLEILFPRERDVSPQVMGEIQGDGFGFALPPSSFPASDCYFRFQFLGEKITIPSLSMKIGNSPLKIHGTLIGWEGLRGELSVYSDFFDCADLMPRQGGISNRGEKSILGEFLKEMDIRVGVVFERGRWKKIHWGPFRAALDCTGGNLNLRHASLRSEHGVVEATGRYRKGFEPELLLSGHIQVADQPVESLLESVGIDDGRIKGTLALRGLLTIKGGTKEEWISSLSGGADILMTRGTIRKSTFLIKVLDFLSLQKIFHKKPPELSKEGFYYQSISAQTTLDNGILESQNMVMESPVVNGVASGKVDLGTRTLDIDLGIRPLETLDTAVGSIPILGHIVTGPEKSFLTYYFKAKGPWSNPEVQYIPFKNLGSGVAGVLKRLLMTPVRIFKDLSGAISPGPEKAPAREADGKASGP